MRRFSISAGLALLLSASVVPGEEASYRLAGIVAPENRDAIALIELPDGEQRLFRAGDSIDDGRVAEVTSNTVRLEFSQGEIVLQLAGTGNPESNLPTEYRPEDYPGGMPNPIDPQALQAISKLAETADETESQKLASQVLAYLNLPVNARIMAVDDKAVDSTADAVRRMAAKIETKQQEGSTFQFVVSIAEVAGNKRVYIFTDGAGQVRDRTIQLD